MTKENEKRYEMKDVRLLDVVYPFYEDEEGVFFNDTEYIVVSVSMKEVIICEKYDNKSIAYDEPLMFRLEDFGTRLFLSLEDLKETHPQAINEMEEK